MKTFDYEAAPVLVHWERNGNDKKNNLMMSLHKKQMREERAKMKKREIRQSESQMIVVRTTGSDQNLAFLIISYQTSRWIIVAVIIVMLAHS